MAASGYYAASGSTFFKWIQSSANITWTNSNQKSGVNWIYRSAGAYYLHGSNVPSFNLSYTYGCRASVSGSLLTISRCTFVNVSVSSNGNGSVSGGGTNLVAGVQSVTITATPSTNYRFVSWSDGNTSSSRTFSPGSDYNLSATFERSRWIITLAGANSTNKVVYKGYEYSSGVTIPVNSSFAVKSYPSSGYVFYRWSSSAGGSSTSNPWTGLAATQNITYTVECKARFSISVTAGANGQVGIGSGAPSSHASALVTQGGSVSLVAYPSAHYAFEEWYSSSPSPYTFYDNPQSYQPTLNRTWAASFVQFEWPVSVTADGNGTAYVGHGTLTTDWFKIGDDIFLRAEPTNGLFNAFDYWRETSGTTPLPYGREVWIVKSVAGAGNFTAVFKERTYSLTVARANIDAEDAAVWGDVKLVYHNEAPLETDDVVASVIKDVYTHYNPVTITATPRAHGVFVKWVYGDNHEATAATIQVNGSDYETLAYTAYFEEAGLYDLDLAVLGDGAVADGNAIAVTSHAGMGTGDDAAKYYGGEVTVEATPATGWEVVRWYSTGTGEILKGEAGFGNSFTFNLDQDSDVECTFALRAFSVKWGVHAKSEGHGTIGEQYRAPNGQFYYAYDEENDRLVYGSSMMLTATAASGDRFVGWFNAHDERISENTVFIIIVTQDVEYVAKFGSTASVDVHWNVGTVVPPQNTATVAHENGTQSVESVLFTYGESVSYAANAQPGYYFKGWYEDGELRTDLPEAFTVEPTNAISLSALVDDYSTVFYVKMESQAGAFGTLTMVSGGLEITEGSEFEAEAEAIFGEIDFLTERCFQFDSVESVAIACESMTSQTKFKEFKLIQMVYSEGVWVYGQEQLIPTGSQSAVVLSRHCVLRAMYWSPTPTKITLAYVDGVGDGMGVLGFSDPGSNVGTEEHVSVWAEFVQGSKIDIIAVAKSGYKFAGWYSDAAGTVQVSANSEHEITVEMAGTTYYAKFVQDANAIYEFEGGTGVKRLVWQSRRLMATKPFSPSSICVLAEGYPVQAVVKMASSPDAIGVRSMSITLTSQDGRRLALSRPERFLEVEISGQHPVNAVTVGTSMEGVR